MTEFKPEFYETDECLGCGSRRLQSLTYKDRENLGVRYVQCINCTLVFARRYMTDDCLEEFYREEYKRLYPSHALSESKQSQLVRLLKMYASTFSHPTVLDYGCGSGAVLGRLQKAFSSRVGVDYIHESYVRECGASIITHEDLYDRGDKFDIIFLSQVLEHVQSPKLLISELTNYLKNGGILIVEVPGLMAFGRLKSASNFVSQFKFCHKTYFNRYSLLKFIQRHGLDVLHVDNSARIIARKVSGKKIKSNHLPFKNLYLLKEDKLFLSAANRIMLIFFSFVDYNFLLKLKKKFRSK